MKYKTIWERMYTIRDGRLNELMIFEELSNWNEINDQILAEMFYGGING